MPFGLANPLNPPQNVAGGLLPGFYKKPSQAPAGATTPAATTPLASGPAIPGGVQPVQPPPAAPPPAAPPAIQQNQPFDLPAAEGWADPSSPGGTPLDPTGGLGFPSENAKDAPLGDFGTALAALMKQFYPDQAGAGATGEQLAYLLPGRNKASDQVYALLLNLAAAQAQQQQGRGAQAEGIYGALASEGPQSAPYGLAMDAATQARNRIDPAALAGYEASLRGRAASDAGQGFQTSMQRLRDAGFLGRGGMSVDPALAASNAANSQLSQANLDISGIIEQLTGNRLAQAGQLGEQGANVWQGLGAVPRLNYAQQLQTNPNQAMPQLQELLNQLGQIGVSGDVAHRNAPSDFERIGVPLLAAGLGGAADVASSGIMAGAIASDRRLKADIRYTGESWGGVPVVTFRWKTGGPLMRGVIAQDAEVLRPDVVTEIGGIKHVYYGRL